MNFFEHQDYAKRKTKFLILYFLIALLLIITAIDLIVVLIVLTNQGDLFFAVLPQPPEMLISHHATAEHIQALFFAFFPYVSLGVITVVFLGTIFRILNLRAGGISVAELSGATPIDLETKDPDERKFINVVEEMSIASGIPIPKLYIMRSEPSINAFVAGIRPADTVMVVTEGALRTLNRDELQGVIGHEYSHILNSDMQISVRLIGLLAGILLISQIGYFIIRSVSRSTRGSSKKGGGSFAIILFGVGLFLVGYIGLFFGRLIKSAISRQRELLADSCSVQFTRYPTGLVSALQKINNSTLGTQLNTRHAEDISHLCFCPSISILFTHLLDTHPPIQYRIKAIDPTGQYRQEAYSRRQAESPPTQKPVPKKEAIIAVPILVTSIGSLSSDHIEFASNILNTLPQDLENLCHDPHHVERLYYAFALSQNSSPPLQKFLSGEEIAHVKKVEKQLNIIDTNMVFPLINLSLPAFKTKPVLERKKILDQLQELFDAEQLTLLEFTLLGMLGKYVKDRTPAELRPKYNKLEEVVSSLEILFSYLIFSTNYDEATQETRFKKITAELLLPAMKKLPAATLNVQVFLSALKELNLLTPLCKQRVIKTCLLAIEEDNKITVTEAELVRAIAICLDCPIPPILFPF